MSCMLNVYEVVNKLIGEITPVGETNEDAKRFENLEQIIILIEKLVWEIEKISEYENRVEYSMKKIGKRASEFRNELTAWKN